MDLLRRPSPFRVCLLLILFFTLNPSSFAQWHATGLVGTLSRLQTGSLNFQTFLSGPESTTTPVIGAEGGRSLWKLTVDGTLLSTNTGQTQTFIGPTQQFSQTTSGHALLLDGGAEWPILLFRGFRVLARGGYGRAWVHIPTVIPIDDHSPFWTYGFVGTRNIGSHFVLRIDVRNEHFRREAGTGISITNGSGIPETLGRFNVTALGGFGLRF